MSANTRIIFVMGIVCAIVVAAAFALHDPNVEIAPGFKLPRSVMAKLDCSPTNGIDGRAYIWCAQKQKK